MKKAFLFFAFLPLSYGVAFAQNLLKNPSFEEGARCDGSTENLDTVAHWRRVAGSPRFINPQCPLDADTKTYIQGMQIPPAYEGDVYAGIGMDIEGEFLQGTLEKPLKQGEVYWIKMRVRLPSRFCSLPIQEMGVYFSNALLPASDEYKKLNFKGVLQLKREDNKPIDKTFEWQELSMMYTATGEEQYITFGNFATSNAAMLQNRKQGECSYLFVDQLSIEVFKEVALRTFQKEMEFLKGERVWLKNVQFDKERLTKNAEKELKELAAILQKSPDTKIEISGHTDNTTESVAGNRAQIVSDFLVKKGVAVQQLKTMAKGSSQNIVPNNTPDNIAKNNRIEMRLL